MTPPDGRARPIDPERLLADRRWLLRLAHGLLGDEHLALDVAQEAQMRALAHPAGDSARGGGWLRRIARNVALSMRASDERRAAREHAAAVPERTTPTDELVARVQMQRAVADAVLALDEPYRDVVLLRFFDELPPREIAARFGVPVETVRTRLKRALERLRARLDAGAGSREAWSSVLIAWPVVGWGEAAASASSAGVTAKISTTTVSTTGSGAAVVLGALAMSTAGKVAAAVVAAGAAVLAWTALHAPDPVGSTGGAPSGDVAIASSETEAPTGATSAIAEDPAAAPTSARVEIETGESEVGSLPRAPIAARFVATIVEVADGSPIGGAELWLRHRTSTDESAEFTLATARSGGDGRVELALAAIDPWGVKGEVRARDHAPLVLRDSEIPIREAKGGVVRLGELALERGAVVRGRVTYARDGSPASGARLRLQTRPLLSSEFGLAGCRDVGTTLGDGTFELTERAASKLDWPLTLFAIADDGIGWGYFKTTRGNELVEDVAIEIDPSGALLVSVADESGAPVVGARARAEPHFAPLGPGKGWTLTHTMWLGDDARIAAIFSGATDAHGRLELPRLPIGRYSHHLEHVDSSPFDIYDVVVDFGGFDRAVAAGVRVNASNRVDMSITLLHEATFALVGSVLDPAGVPLEHALVEEGGSERHCRVAADGSYRLDGLSTAWGGLSIRVRIDAFREVHRWHPLADLPLTSDQDDSPSTRRLDFVLERTASIAGRVIDERGVPVAGAPVSFNAVIDDEPESLTYGAEPTDAGGRFVLESVSEREWQITVGQPPGDRTLERWTRSRAHGGDTDVVIICRDYRGPRGRLIAEIVDAASRQPAEATRAFVLPLELGATRRDVLVERETGRVECSRLAPGRFELYLQDANHWQAIAPFQIAHEDDVARIRVELGPPGRVEARLELAPELGTPETRRLGVFWIPRDGHWIEDGRPSDRATNGYARFDARGRFVADGFVPDRLVRFWITDRELYDEALVTPRSGESVEVVLRPARPGILQLRVPADLPDGELRFELSSNDGPWQPRYLTTDPVPGPGVNVERVVPGRHRWRAAFAPDQQDPSEADVRLLEGELEAAAGVTVEIDLAGLK